MSKRKPDIDKNCEVCGKNIVRNIMSDGSLEDYGDYTRRKHCNQKCMGKSEVYSSKGKKSIIVAKSGYIAIYSPEHPHKNKWGYVNEHVLKAEKALGKPLPKGAVVHHANGSRDNGPLVICQDTAYHSLLHQRERALKACGHSSWRKCNICKKWDAPEKLSLPKKPKGHVYHKSCACEAQKERNRHK
ncbi:MAG: hypothetical protein WC749_01860 [Dehalococcoidia bacterium]